MKNLILITCLFVSMCTFAQSEKTNFKVSPFFVEEVEVSPPQFTGIENVAILLQEKYSESVKAHMTKNVIYPKNAIKQLREGTEVVQFEVTADGKVTDFEIINSVSSEIDEEVIRVLETTSGMWKPGLNNGIPTAMKKEVSMLFKVDETNYDVIIKNFTAKAKYHYKIASRNLFLKHNTRKALRHFNTGITYLPNDVCLLTLRGLCKYELGDEDGARRDWDRINKLASNSDNTKSDFDYLSYDTSELKGYAELNRILRK